MGADAAKHTFVCLALLPSDLTPTHTDTDQSQAASRADSAAGSSSGGTGGATPHAAGGSVPSEGLGFNVSSQGSFSDASPRTVLGSGPDGPVSVSLRLPHRGQVEGACFEVFQLPVGRIAGICKARVSVDVPGLVDEIRASAYHAAVAALTSLVGQHAPKDPPLVDPARGEG